MRLHDWRVCIGAALQSGDIGFAETYHRRRAGARRDLAGAAARCSCANRDAVEQVVYG
jgi:hypothetical protein